MKRDVNDALYSDIIRFGVERCFKCLKKLSLQCAHIFSRSHYSTRFGLDPVPNAIPLCFSCHDWFDTHKITALVFDEKKRVFAPNEESFTFLVGKIGYNWNQLTLLYAKSAIPFQGYTWKKKEITTNLKKILKKMKSDKKNLWSSFTLPMQL